MSNPLASFLALESDERRIVLQAMVMLPAMVLRLRRHGYKAALAQVEQTRMGSAGRLSQYRIGTLFQIGVRRTPVKGACLAQSLVLLRPLRLNGLAGHVEIGVRREDGEFKAHAWVEDADGYPVNDRVDITDDYADFDLGRMAST